MSYLSFILDQHLIAAVEKIIRKFKAADVNTDIHKNVIDPFSALFDGVVHNMPFGEWIKIEKIRQVQKTMQNAIGDFHQDVLGNIVGSENLGLGGGLDVRHKEMKIIAEIKNKYNTTKGNHKTAIYDSIKLQLEKPEYIGYTGYYVEIISQNKKEYNKTFTPSDNNISKRREENEHIRVIDGKSFYTLLTGREFALQEVFEVLPKVIMENFQYKFENKAIQQYIDLFAIAYNIK